MKALIDEKIDNRIKAIISNFSYKYNEENLSKYEDILIAYLSNTNIFYNQIIIFHIFIYNYILFSIIYENSPSEVLETLSTLSNEELLKLIKNNHIFFRFLIRNYLRVIYQPNLLELVTDNLEKSEELTSLSASIKEFKKIETITEKLNNYLEELYSIYSSLDENKTEAIILNILKTDQDPLNIFSKFFLNKKEYQIYKPILIQMLFLDTYLFLLQQQEEWGSLENTKYLAYIKEKICQSDFSTLPSDYNIASLLLTAFYYLNINRPKLIKSHPEALNTIKKETRGRIHPIVLINYF